MSQVGARLVACAITGRCCEPTSVPGPPGRILRPVRSGRNSRIRRNGLALEQVAERLDDPGDGHAPLPAAIAVAKGDGVLGERLTVDRDAEGSPGLILPAIPPADSSLLIIEDVEVPSQIAIDGLGLLGHAVTLDQREDRGLDGRDPGMELEHGAGLATDLVLGVSLAQEGQRRAVGAG